MRPLSAIALLLFMFVFVPTTSSAMMIFYFPVLTPSEELGYAGDVVSDGVEPNTSSGTPFTFKIISTSHYNTANEVDLLVSDGTTTTTYIMQRDLTTASTTLIDGDYINGEQYFYTGTFPTGNYTYHFETFGTQYPEMGEETFSVSAGPVDICAGVENCNSNVLFLPGIMGSRLFENSFVCGILTNEKERWVSTLDCDQARLALRVNGTSVNQIYTKEGEVGVINEAYSFNLYKSFMSDLKKWKETDKIIADYALIPYDWRLSLEDVLQNGATSTDGTFSYGASQGFANSHIYRKLTEMVASSRTKKVTIIAHSNGGLVTKALIQKLKETHDPLYDKIDKIIFVAVPQTGTPEAISNILHGDQIGPMGSIMSANRLRDLTQNMPGAYHLLPSAAYFAGEGATVPTPIVTFEDGTATQPFINLYGHSIANASDLKRFLLGEDGRPTPTYDDLEDPTKLNFALLSYAENLHQQLDDNWEVSSSTNIYQIAGWGVGTLANINYRTVPHCDRVDSVIIQGARNIYCGLWGSRLTFDPNKVIDGDGTVVMPSALAMSTSSDKVTRYWVDLDRYGKSGLFNSTINRVHKDILEVPQLCDFIHNIISFSLDTLPVYISTSTPPSTNYTDRLTFTLHSPLTLEFTDTEGRHVGPSTSTPDTFDSNVPGATYERYGEVRLLSIPKTATGTLTLHGVASGSFTLDLAEENGNITIATTSFEGITSATSTVVTMTIDPISSPITNGILTVDTNGDGTTIEILHAHEGETVFSDTTPPEARIGFSTSTQQLRTIGLDVSPTNAYKTATTTTVIDSVGNVTIIHFSSYKAGNHSIKAKIDSISYNGVATVVSAELSYKWSMNKKGEYTMFAAYIKTATGIVESHYRPKKNQTIIMTKAQDFDDEDNDDECDKRATSSKVSGMVIPGLVTNQGKINVNY
ncbi:MAG: hypothetical protein A2845_05415 [Candidatus Lloydbacteria bacterium RIFCSPHIGHO2_01_FULL_49_22]|uniref:Uncharacterized protein n=1 Tax=Candidatus Lloydbacteria bacterium RIFCSPHIGHO2_01_FULL_49_22 TaxID=1798658 RepID=A0A1G2CU04_9BACT|nr:MAG: hypothetical protein A2845_05415 [Candidatus Lloydbacteria bacterium RIFCSPHIGHO2_01_FULL_49_22]OGZ09139.1 MAG: hypothetical protein A3C14_04100 [Candidatus Lloydbacteria bacterium RIFCSPHIGHO2_02_FULL_50_18]